MNPKELKQKREELNASTDKIFKKTDDIIAENKRVIDVAENASAIIKDLDKEFSSQTKLNKKDVVFLFSAIALQCVRQYMLTDFKPRTDHKTAAGKTNEHSDRHGWYNISAENIWSNPVPFDTTFGSPALGANLGGDHRAKTLGHDPLLGWIFGTANIATSTVTSWNLQSYHVKTGINASGHNLDKITHHAKTSKVFLYTYDKMIGQGLQGKIIVGSSVIKEAIHLKSDIGSHFGLTLPGLSMLSPKLARGLADYGIDMGNVLNVGTQASMAILINTLIAMIHRMFYDESKFSSISSYEVKTRKILSYSNLIASLSNVIYVAVSTYLGNANAVKKLDVGGFLVTIYRLITDSKFINQVKQEFIVNEFNKRIRGDF